MQKRKPATLSRFDRALRAVLDTLFKRECIKHDGRPILYRWIIWRTASGAAAYIHHFVASDGREMHDHPKAFTTIGLIGGYTEVSAEPGEPGRLIQMRCEAPWWRAFPAHHIHRIVLRAHETCWTIALVGAKSRSWGFFVPGHVWRWRDHPWADDNRRHRWVHFRDFNGLRTTEERELDPETATGYRLPDGKPPGERVTGGCR